jgi:hypothetical protein
MLTTSFYQSLTRFFFARPLGVPIQNENQEKINCFSPENLPLLVTVCL